jgi:S-adenosylmethionine/arginine decarboxylase-like enzyme
LPPTTLLKLNFGIPNIYLFYHLFNNNAITFVFLLSESHCTVHTYPEYQSLFIDSFTCGNNFDIQRFHDLLTWRFKPKELPEYQIINSN